MKKKAKIGLIGLGVMGQALTKNFAKSNYIISVFNRSNEKTKEFQQSCENLENIIYNYSLSEFIDSLEIPRKIILIVKSGEAVDDLIFRLVPLLGEGDLIADFGNSYYKDSIRRYHFLEREEINYLDCGISGGEFGALNGPSLMVSGSGDGYKLVEEMFQKISATNIDNGKCCHYFGSSGAGNFIKMVHNGIEYAIMELIAEAYLLLLKSNHTNLEISKIFAKFNQGKLSSYLMDISSKILVEKDTLSKKLLIQKISDVASMNSSGAWALQSAYEYELGFSLLSAALESRISSKNVNTRNQFFEMFKQKVPTLDLAVYEIENTLYCGILIAFAQGFELLRKVSVMNGYYYSLKDVARVWRGGCIIQGSLVEEIYDELNIAEIDPDNILSLPKFRDVIISSQNEFRLVVLTAIDNNVPVVAMQSAISYIDLLSFGTLPTNLIQAQRDYFGAHKFTRVDDNKNELLHHNWHK